MVETICKIQDVREGTETVRPQGLAGDANWVRL